MRAIATRYILTALLLSCTLGANAVCTSAAWAESNNGQGTRLYHEGRFDEAAELFKEALKKDETSGELHFNTGAALYKSGKFNEADEEFTRALLTNDKSLEAQALYNLGNTRYMLARQEGRANPQQAIRQYKDALDYYEKAIALDKDNREARYNHELVRQEMLALEKQSKSQQKQDKKDQKQQEQEDRENNNSSQDDNGPSDKSKQNPSPQQDRKPGEQKQDNKQQGKEQDGKDKQSQAGEQKDSSGSKAKDASDATGNDKPAPRGSDKNRDRMTKQEARMLLQSFSEQQGNKPLMFQKKRAGGTVENDW